MNPPFRADQVGSLLRPAELTEARTKAKRGEIDAAALRAVEELSRPRAAARFFTSRTQTLAYRGASCRDAELNNGHAGNGQINRALGLICGGLFGQACRAAASRSGCFIASGQSGRRNWWRYWMFQGQWRRMRGCFWPL